MNEVGVLGPPGRDHADGWVPASKSLHMLQGKSDPEEHVWLPQSAPRARRARQPAPTKTHRLDGGDAEPGEEGRTPVDGRTPLDTRLKVRRSRLSRGQWCCRPRPSDAIAPWRSAGLERLFRSSGSNVSRRSLTADLEMCRAWRARAGQAWWCSSQWWPARSLRRPRKPGTV